MRGTHLSAALAVTGATLELVLLPMLRESGSGALSTTSSHPTAVTRVVNGVAPAVAFREPSPGSIGVVQRWARPGGASVFRSAASPVVQLPGLGGPGFGVPAKPGFSFVTSGSTSARVSVSVSASPAAKRAVGDAER